MALSVAIEEETRMDNKGQQLKIEQMKAKRKELEG